MFFKIVFITLYQVKTTDMSNAIFKHHGSYFLIVFLSFLASCDKKNTNTPVQIETDKDQFVISFASCSNQHIPNLMWGPILSNEPDVFIWGGDIIYSDTYDMKVMKDSYHKMKSDSAYSSFRKKVPVSGTWDDHDYGINDGGAEYIKKDSVQQLFLDFFDVDDKDPRRLQKGIYDSQLYQIEDVLINIIILDTRYFRSELTKDPEGIKRYIPSDSSNSTMLGKEQWSWLETELSNSKADFNIIMSSIQFLSSEHGFETWGNMPKEVEKMKGLLLKTKAKRVIILSGDRHIAEISKADIDGLPYPLVDFTSSGMTHSYDSFSEEENKFRVSEVVSDKNFGILRFDLNKKEVKMEIRGEGNHLFQSFSQKYE